VPTYFTYCNRAGASAGPLLGPLQGDWGGEEKGGLPKGQ